MQGRFWGGTGKATVLHVDGAQTWTLLRKRNLTCQFSVESKGSHANPQRLTFYFKTTRLTAQEEYSQSQKYIKEVWNDQVCNLTCSWYRNQFCLLCSGTATEAFSIGLSTPICLAVEVISRFWSFYFYSRTFWLQKVYLKQGNNLKAHSEHTAIP